MWDKPRAGVPLAASSAPGTSAPRMPQVITNENNYLLGSEKHDLCLPKPRARLAKRAGSCGVCPGVRVAWGGSCPCRCGMRA